MIKIMHLITDLATGGAEVMLYKVLSCLDRSQFQNSVVSMTDRGSLGDKIETLQVPVFTLGLRRGIPDPRALFRLLRLLRAERPHILQTWLYHSDLLGLAAGRLARVPVVAWNTRCSDMDLREYPKLTSVVLRILVWLSRFPDVVIYNSNAGQLFHQCLGYQPRKSSVIPNGFDLDEFRPDPDARFWFRKELGLSPVAPLVGLVARYDPMKDHENFLRAAASVVKQRPGIHFVLVGRGVDGSNQGLITEIRNHNISLNLHLLGTRHDIRNIMPALDMLVLSSAFGEGFPNVLGEAMAAGVPCIVTNVGDAPKIVGDTGRVVQAKDADGLAAAIREVVDMPAEERDRLGRAARRRIEECFSLASVVRQYEGLYRELTASLPESQFPSSLLLQQRPHTACPRTSERLHQNPDKSDL
jgi:glycosyltransferase involved in cell wall biosynthesis